MRLFIVCVGRLSGLELASGIARTEGFANYADADEVPFEGIQDPYAAIEHSDAIIWVTGSEMAASGLGRADYNHLYADTVLVRAVEKRRPIFYYHVNRHDVESDDRPVPQILRHVTRRHVVSSESELETALRCDLHDLTAGRFAKHVFISYSTADAEFVEKLSADLQRSGLSPWVAAKELNVGDSLLEIIENAITVADYFVVVLSPEAVASRWVSVELETALLGEIQSQRTKVLPILHRKCEIPPFVSRKLYADFTTSYASGFQQLIRALAGSPVVRPWTGAYNSR